MTAAVKRHRSVIRAFVLGIIGTLILCLPRGARGAETVILSYADFLPTQTSSTLTLQRFRGTLRVDSTTVGDFEIFLPIPSTFGRKILSLFACYRTENAANFIAATSLINYVVGNPGLVYTDTTARASTTAACYAAAAPSGGVTLQQSAPLMTLTLHFGATGGISNGIFIGAVGVVFE